MLIAVHNSQSYSMNSNALKTYMYWQKTLTFQESYFFFESKSTSFYSVISLT